MGWLIILGSANAVPDELHDNTHLLIQEGQRIVLVDCASGPVQRLQKIGTEINGITDLILTHFHPDHVSGVPLLLMVMWLTGRTKSLEVYGLAYTLDRIETLMGLFEWEKWPGFFPVIFHRLDGVEQETVLDCAELRILSSPVHHLIPTIGLRVEYKKSGKSFGYSCDTEPCDEVVCLAKGVDVLLHEAHGVNKGHSSAAQAAGIATRAGARMLYLIHYPTPAVGLQAMIEEAKANFSGQVELAQDLKSLVF
jgi:ribonuclease Z